MRASLCLVNWGQLERNNDGPRLDLLFLCSKTNIVEVRQDQLFARQTGQEVEKVPGKLCRQVNIYRSVNKQKCIPGYAYVVSGVCFFPEATVVLSTVKQGAKSRTGQVGYNFLTKRRHIISGPRRENRNDNGRDAWREHTPL